MAPLSPLGLHVACSPRHLVDNSPAIAVSRNTRFSSSHAPLAARLITRRRRTPVECKTRTVRTDAVRALGVRTDRSLPRRDVFCRAAPLWAVLLSSFDDDDDDVNDERGEHVAQARRVGWREHRAVQAQAVVCCPCSCVNLGHGDGDDDGEQRRCSRRACRGRRGQEAAQDVQGGLVGRRDGLGRRDPYRKLSRGR